MTDDIYVYVCECVVLSKRKLGLDFILSIIQHCVAMIRVVCVHGLQNLYRSHFNFELRCCTYNLYKDVGL
jgi:hypothetical protein